MNSSDELGTSLGANVVIILLWASATTLYFLKIEPYPINLTGAGAFLGLIGGFFQFASFKQVKQNFEDGQISLDLGPALKTTSWGVRHKYYIWISHLLLALLAFFISTPPYFGLLAGIFALLLIREIVAFCAIIKLNNLITER